MPLKPPEEQTVLQKYVPIVNWRHRGRCCPVSGTTRSQVHLAEVCQMWRQTPLDALLAAMSRRQCGSSATLCVRRREWRRPGEIVPGRCLTDTMDGRALWADVLDEFLAQSDDYPITN